MQLISENMATGTTLLVGEFVRILIRFKDLRVN